MLPIILTEQDRLRFEKYLARAEATGCLLWTAGCFPNGHGSFSLNGRHVRAHRVAFLLGGGILTPERPFVLHNCPAGDNPACCEFTHLWAGTQADNVRDMARKGRGRKSKRGLPFGAYAHRTSGFVAQIRVNGKPVYLGLYPTAEKASAVALSAKSRI